MTSIKASSSLRGVLRHTLRPPAPSTPTTRLSPFSTSSSSCSSSSSSSFPCVDANEARGARLKARADAAAAASARATSCSSSNAAASSSSSSSPRGPPLEPIAFPCVDANEARSQRLRAAPTATSTQGPELDYRASDSTSDGGPEPSYTDVVSGYKLFHHPSPFELDYGGVLPSFDIAYETWGELNHAKDNAILLHTGLSASSHAASHPDNPAKGWWEAFIGPNKPLDTNKYFVVCTNVLGGCYGSTGPSSPHPLDPEGKPYATRFPILSIFDMVRAQFLLLDHLGIGKLYASVGSSMGGMQSVAAGHLEPERVERIVSISGCARSGPSSVALRFAQRSVLMSDPNWNRGDYYGPGKVPPHQGMKLARQIATITYRSGPEWEQRFGRQRRRLAPDGPEQEPALCPDFLIETYLDYQGEQFCLKYDANSLIYISKAMDLFDMSEDALRDLERRKAKRRGQEEEWLKAQEEEDRVLAEEGARKALQATKSGDKRATRQYIQSLSSESAHNYLSSLARGLKRLSNKRTLIMGAHSDILFPQEQQQELFECLKLNGNERTAFYSLSSPYGHDTFLIDVQGVGGALRGFLNADDDS